MAAPFPPDPRWYPAAPPPKPRWHRRKWVQLMSVGSFAFVLGLGLGAAPTTEVQPPAPAAEPDRSLTTKLQRVESSNERLEDELVDQGKEALATQQAAVRSAQSRARAAQRVAVRAARAEMRTWANVRQRKAVAAAVERTESEMQARAVAAPPAEAAGGGATDPRFSYCYEANDAGYGNYVSGVDAEYDWYDDNDGDGQVCEF